MKKFIRFLWKAFVLYFCLYGMQQFVGTNLFRKPSSNLNIEDYYIEIDGKTSELTLEEKMADYDYFCAYMKDNYPFFQVEKRKKGTSFLEHELDYREKIKQTNNNYEFYLVMDKVFEFFISPHTYLISPKGDGYKNHECLNSDSIKTNTFILDQEGLWSDYLDAEMPTSLSDKTEDYLTYIDLEEAVFYIKINNFANDFGDDIKIKLLEAKKNYKHIIIDIQDNYGGYINYSKKFILPAIINTTISGKYEYYMLFTKAHNEILKEAYSTNVDLSFKKIEELNNRQLLKDELKFKIKALQPSKEHDVNIHLIINKNTTSSADYFARICKDNDLATLYGEMTAGEGILNSYALFYLPNSGLVISYNPFYGYNSDGTNNTEFGTLPDIEMDLTNKAEQEIIDLIFRSSSY